MKHRKKSKPEPDIIQFSKPSTLSARIAVLEHGFNVVTNRRTPADFARHLRETMAPAFVRLGLVRSIRVVDFRHFPTR